MKRAVCNEMFGRVPFERACDYCAEYGFEGVEIAPFTLFNEDMRIDSDTMGRIRRTLSQHGIQYAGLHWLLSKPDGLHITSPDSQLRRKTREHLKHLLDVSGELGGGNLVLGSPRQRRSLGISATDAVRYLAEELSQLSEYAEQCDSKVLLEPLPKKVTDVVNTMDEVTEVLEMIDHTAISAMFDFHNCVDETLNWAELIREYSSIIRHVHLNTWEGEYPLPDQFPQYEEAFRALDQIGYTGWVSLEVFAVYDQPEEVLSITKEFLDAVLWEID